MVVNKKSSYTTHLVVRASKRNEKYCSKKNFKTKLSKMKQSLPSPANYYPNHLMRFKRNSKQATALCPFHAETNPSFTVELSTGKFYCFSCGAHGTDIIGFHAKKYGLSFKQACEDLGVWYE